MVLFDDDYYDRRLGRLNDKKDDVYIDVYDEVCNVCLCYVRMKY
jgi:hypothetical protein